MRTAEGGAHFVCANGKRRAAVRVSSEPSGWWGWSASRDFPTEDAGKVDRYVRVGRAKTWATAYRASMRAAERLLAMREWRASA